jgi:hypothetical protein
MEHPRRRLLKRSARMGPGSLAASAIGKSFDHAAVVSHLHPATLTRHFDEGRDLAQGQRRGAPVERPAADDLERRRAGVAPVALLRSRCRRHHCGTPESVGPVKPDDVMQGPIDGLYDIHVKVV